MRAAEVEVARLGVPLPPRPPGAPGPSPTRDPAHLAPVSRLERAQAVPRSTSPAGRRAAAPAPRGICPGAEAPEGSEAGGAPPPKEPGRRTRKPRGPRAPGQVVRFLLPVGPVRAKAGARPLLPGSRRAPVGGPQARRALGVREAPSATPRRGWRRPSREERSSTRQGPCCTGRLRPRVPCQPGLDAWPFDSETKSESWTPGGPSLWPVPPWWRSPESALARRPGGARRSGTGSRPSAFAGLLAGRVAQARAWIPAGAASAGAISRSETKSGPWAPERRWPGPAVLWWPCPGTGSAQRTLAGRPSGSESKRASFAFLALGPPPGEGCRELWGEPSRGDRAECHRQTQAHRGPAAPARLSQPLLCTAPAGRSSQESGPASQGPLL